MRKFTIGIDYGTMSGRAVLMDAQSGEIVATHVSEYSHGVMDRTLPSGTPLPSNTVIQHPGDYVEVLRTVIPEVMKAAGVIPQEVVGVGVDFTGCTIMAVDKNKIIIDFF